MIDMGVFQSLKNFLDQPAYTALYTALINNEEEASFFFVARYPILFPYTPYGEQNRLRQHIKKQMKEMGFPENGVEVRFYSRKLNEKKVKVIRTD